MAQNAGYDRFSPAANGWGTIHHQETTQPLQAEEGGATNLKKLIPGMIHALTCPPYD
jgi:hypothetical protein